MAVISALVVLVLVAGTLLVLGFGGTGPLSALLTKSSQTTNAKTPTATLTARIPAGFQVFTSPGHFYSVAYPSAWTTSTDQPNQESETFTGSANLVALVDDSPPNAGVTPASFTAGVCSLVGGGASTGPTPVTIGGQGWTRMECDSSDASTHTLVEAVTYKGRMYSFISTSDQPSFAQNQTQFFSVMEQSFTFLS